MECKICHELMDKVPVTVDTWVCNKNHGGTQPKIGAAVLACPLSKGAIWVHVVDDDGDDVPGVPFTTAGKEKNTKAGFASWDPLDDDKTYEVVAGTLPKEFLPLAIPFAKNVVVHKGEITSVEFVLERAQQMTVIVKEGDKPGSIKDIQVDISGRSPDDTRNGKTLAVDGATFLRLHKGLHTVKIALDKEQKKKYWLDGEATQDKDVISKDPNEVVFTLQLIVFLNVTFHVQEKTPDALKEMVGAKVKLKDPDLETPTALSETKAVAKFEIAVASREPKTSVQLVSFQPDDTEAVYEVIEVVSA